MSYDREPQANNGGNLPAQIRKVRAAQADGARRDGCDLSGGRRRARLPEVLRRQEGDRREERSRQGESLSRRGQGGAAPLARQPGPHLRRRRGRRRVLHRDGAGRGEGPARDLEPLRPHPHAHPARRRAARGARDRPRAGLRPLARRPAPGPPRRRAAQHPHQLLRRGEADRLRSGAQRAQAGEHRPRRGLRPRVVPVARAGARRDRRRAHRHLQPGDRAVGAGDREPVPAARQPRPGDGDVAGAPPARAAAVVEGSLDHAEPRRAPDARAGPGSRASVSVGRGDAQGALRDHRADLAARRRRADRRLPARPLRPGGEGGARRARQAAGRQRPAVRPAGDAPLGVAHAGAAVIARIRQHPAAVPQGRRCGWASTSPGG